MTLLNATDLSTTLGVSKARVSQYVSEGKLDGCFTGEGRKRRFDLGKCASALGRNLDKGQLLGNGSQTRLTLAKLSDDDTTNTPPATLKAQRTDGRLAADDPDEYTLIRTQIQQEELRRKRRDNAEAEGRFVLASAVEQQVKQVLAQMISEVEATVIRDGARAIADQLGVDFKKARKILLDTWRAHRKDRSEALTRKSAEASAEAAETEADI